MKRQPPRRRSEVLSESGRRRESPGFSRGEDVKDWTRFEPEALEGRTAHAHTVEGTCVTGRLARVAGPIDQLVFEGVLQPVLLRLHGGQWRLAGGWHDLEVL